MKVRRTDAFSVNTVDAICFRPQLKQAADQYPRLLVLGFTLVVSVGEMMTPDWFLLLRFQREVQRRIQLLSENRQAGGLSSPPTVLRWFWGTSSTSECRILLMMNLDTVCPARTEPSVDTRIQVMMILFVTPGVSLPGTGMNMGYTI